MQNTRKRECIRVDGEEAGTSRTLWRSSLRLVPLSIQSNTPAIISPSTVNGAARFSDGCRGTTATRDTACSEYTRCLLTCYDYFQKLLEIVKYFSKFYINIVFQLRLNYIRYLNYITWLFETFAKELQKVSNKSKQQLACGKTKTIVRHLLPCVWRQDYFTEPF